ncbi:MAG TPA: D-2-hydroxyacid dehydrogenase [Candidatus Micrarchaeaceae archaeon]|nr:D-2-hydroxyacid dehydrogenase [Candidatus Micrarchaeaceae archaeon]
MPATDRAVPVLIATWLDPRHAERILAAEPERIELIYEPELLPTTRYEADHHGPPRPLTDEQRLLWQRHLGRAEVSFEFDWERPEELLKRAPRLRWVQSTSSGIGPLVERLGLAGSRLLITNAAGIHAQPLAEFVLLTALYFAKEMPQVNAWKEERHWERFCGREVFGSRMTLIGLGRVGSRIAELSSALGIEVTGHRRTTEGQTPPGVRRVVDAAGLDVVMPDTDILVIAAPDTPETVNLIDRRRLALLPANAVVVNVGRGSLIDEQAMIEMLQSGRLRGAGLDVFAKEPLPVDSPLWAMPNVIVSPHSASTVVHENDRLVDLFIENLHRYLDGRPLVNVFDHARKY